jgi:DNA-3-methyladenine glycosylase
MLGAARPTWSDYDIVSFMRPFSAKPLPRSFYARPTLEVAPEMLGKIIVVKRAGTLLAARIVEVEAYLGQLDPASHAYRGPKGRAVLMYGQPGMLYVYFSYGMHYCMNAVAHDGRHAGAVLIRGAEPVLGEETMAANRGLEPGKRPVARGPACVTAAFGINKVHNGSDLTRGEISLHAPREPQAFTIGTSVRIGITQAADKPWRYFICGNKAVSGPTRLNHCS